MNVDDDLEEVELIREKMRQEGYNNLDALEYENLVKLQTRQEQMLQRDTEHFVAEMEGVYNDILENLKTTKATLPKTKEYNDYDLLRNSTLNAPEYIDKRSNFFILDQIMNAIRLNKVVDATSIYSQLMEVSGVDKVSLDFHYGSVINYIETLVPVVRNTLSKEVKGSEQQKRKRESIAKQLLMPVAEDLAKIKAAEKRVYLKQIYKTPDGKFYSVCPVCGEKVPLDQALFSFILFPTERDVSINVLPSPILCKNKHALLFLDFEYVQFSKAIFQDAENGAVKRTAIMGFTRGTESFSKGASLVRVCPTIYEVENDLQYLITEVVDKVSVRNVNSKEIAPTVFTIDDIEYKNAVVQFYNRLRSMRRSKGNLKVQREIPLSTDEQNKSSVSGFPSTESVLSYQEVAVYMMQCLSLDYEVERNKAIFSFLYYLQENPYYSKVFNQEVIWCYRDYVVLLEELRADFRLLPKDVIVELMILHNHFYPEDCVIEDTPEERDRLRINLRKVIPLVKDEITHLENARDSAFQSLRQLKAQLSFVKVLKLSNYKLRELSSYLWSAEVTNFVTEIADRMLITNYAGAFCEYWCKLSLVSKSSIRKNLQKTSYLSHAQKSVTDAIMKMIGKIPQNTFDICFRTDSALHKSLHECYAYFKSYDYYNFCKSVLSITPDINLYFGSDYDFEIRQLQKKVFNNSGEIEQLTSAEFYLKDFTVEELAGKDVSALLEGRFILKRQSDESLEEYSVRFKQVQEDNSFSKVNSYDKMDLFEPLFDFMDVISTFSVLYDIEYDSFIQSMFMVVFINLLMTGFEKSVSARTLGISEENLIFIENETEDLEKIKINFVASETSCRIFNGIYFTSVAECMESFWEDYSNVILKASCSLNKQFKENEPYDALRNVVASEYYKLTDDGEPILDRNEALFEIGAFGADDELVQEIVG